MKKRKLTSGKALALLLALIMMLSMPLSAFAVTGAEVAEDGTYTATIYAVKTSDSKSSTMAVKVENGVISDISFSGGSSSDFKKYLVTNTYGSPKQSEVSVYYDKAASISEIDAMTGASRNTSTKYRMDLKSAIIQALQTAASTDDNGVVPDGTYSVAVTCYKKNKSATLNVKVEGETITDLSFSGSDASDFKKYLITNTYGSPATNEVSRFIGVEASQDAVDSVSGASVNPKTSYQSDLQGAIKNALKTAPAAPNPEPNVGDGIYYGASSTMDNGHWIEVKMTVSEGKFTNLEVVHANGNWDELIDTVKPSYINRVAATTKVDAVSAATAQGYKAAIKEAVEDSIANGGKNERNITKTEAKDSTCTVNGTKEYYTCSVCEKEFLDEECTEETTAESLVADLLPHTLKLNGARNSDCKNDGYVGHYECEVCGKLFLDSNANIELTDDNIKITSNGHGLSKVEATEPTCEVDGAKEHYACAICGEIFDDDQGTTELKKEDVIVAKTGHDWDSGTVTKAATTEEPGVMTYTCKKDDSHTMSFDIPKKVTNNTALAKPVISTECRVSAKTIDVFWRKAANAQSYIVAYKTAESSKWKTVRTKNTYYTLKELKKGDLYEIKVAGVRKVSGKEEIGPYSSVSYRYLAATKIKTKTNAKKTNIKISWSKVKGSSGYQLVYAETKSLNRNRKIVDITGANKKNYKLKKLSAKKDHYVMVRPYKTYKGHKYKGAMSAVRKK